MRWDQINQYKIMYFLFNNSNQNKKNNPMTIIVENTTSRTTKVLKIMDSSSSVSWSALVSSSIEPHGLEATEKPLDVDEDEDKMIGLELFKLEEPVEQPIKYRMTKINLTRRRK